jgi:hypothetical protein
MVDPDEVCLVDGDGVASPDILGVDVSDGDVPGKSGQRNPSLLFSCTD